jgi:hypothetical protein
MLERKRAVIIPTDYEVGPDGKVRSVGVTIGGPTEEDCEAGADLLRAMYGEENVTKVDEKSGSGLFHGIGSCKMQRGERTKVVLNRDGSSTTINLN